MSLTLYTIGHSNGQLAPFIAALSDAGITTLIDVRSRPKSRWGWFNGRALATSLYAAAIDYEYMGDRIGGMPRDPAFAALWQQGGIDGRVIAHLRSTEAWRAAVRDLAARLRDGDAGDVVAIMCSERDAYACHRTAVAEDVAAALPRLSIKHIIAGAPQPRLR